MSNRTLIIVESPTKAKTIGGFLGKQYEVMSSFGHVRDLPTKKFDKTTRFGIDIEHDFQPQYVVPAKAKENVAKLQKAAGQAARVILATDEDREGEAIAWHLAYLLNPRESVKRKTRKVAADKAPVQFSRIAFHEITRQAVEQALEHPRDIDKNMVDAQQARRVLDRLSGYELSQFLWHKIKYGLSAGRVQSVALRLLCEREAQVQEFRQTEYFGITAMLAPAGMKAKKHGFAARLIAVNDEPIKEPGILKKETADTIVENLKQSNFSVQDASKRIVTRSAPAPFTTSTLQQASWQKLHFSAKQTMLVAQQLYEQGLITYMRTDSVNLSKQSVLDARSYINKTFGKTYVPDRFNVYKAKSKLAQEAHEAIRPTDALKTPDAIKQLDARQSKLYTLIWSRFIASQMEKAKLAQQSITVHARSDAARAVYAFRANGQTVTFGGFLAVWDSVQKEDALPEVSRGDAIDPSDIEATRHFTLPPARYNDASLVKTMEELGIGRPSTYASILNTIITRGYVERTSVRSLQPTGLGIIVNDLLVKHFPSILDYRFTAQNEDELDQIASGERIWHEVVRAFYTPFHELVEQKEKEVTRREASERPSDEMCDKCGSPMVVKWGRYGRFLACSNYPACSNIKKMKTEQQDLGLCPTCGTSEGGRIVMRKTKSRGRPFYGCSRWPACAFASWKKPEETENEPSETKPEDAKERSDE